MDKPIRVLQVIGIMNRGGAEAMIMNLYRSIDRSKVQFDFIEHTNERAVYDDEIESLGGKIYRCSRFNGKNYIAYTNWWNNFFNEHKGEYKVIHGHIGSTAAIYLKIAKKHGLFTIAHSHSSGTDNRLKSRLYSIISYPTRYIANYFFACSQIAGIDRYGNKVANSINYKVLKNSVDSSLYKYDKTLRTKIREGLNISDNIVIGHIGRFINAKNHVFLIDIFNEILKLNANCRLLLVGDGDLRPEIESKAKQLGIFDKIIFTGVRSDVNELIQAMDILVFPSLYEGLPVTLVETQTSGLPCVMSDKVPTESILIDGITQICSLSESPETWAKMVLSHYESTERIDRQDSIIKSGYDIAENAKWLGDFYLAKHNEK